MIIMMYDDDDDDCCENLIYGKQHLLLILCELIFRLRIIGLIPYVENEVVWEGLTPTLQIYQLIVSTHRLLCMDD
jgi:hypothetical protein